MYKGFLVDKTLVTKDVHFSKGCSFCHKGNGTASDKASAHAGMVKRPSDDPAVCGTCHEGIAKTYTLSLHYTNTGMKNGIMPRFSAQEAKRYNEVVFEQSCRSCHASCGDCHVKGPVISGISIGLIQGHAFVRKDEGKTCAACHGGRVYPEFTGEYGGVPDVHYQRGMMCMDCHKTAEFHGDGKAYPNRKSVVGLPACTDCHEPGSEKTEAAQEAHSFHEGFVSCYACHTGSQYRNCSDCHVGKGATSNPALILGKNPRKPDELTTLRLIPTVRDTFKGAGIGMENYDSMPNYWNTAAHSIKKRTDRTRSCETCHKDKEYFLTKEMLPKGGSKANEGLIFKF